MKTNDPILAAVLLFAGCFAAWLPMLHRLEFSNSIENIVVETALETRREGHWLVPRMLDEPRTRKPPLAAWASAISMRPETVRALSDPSTRESAYLRLAREMRLPALLAACLTVVLAGELGRVLVGNAVGIATAIITATSLLFLEYARLATPDTHLMLWVTCCNVLLARAVLRGQHWLGFGGAGVCLGLAFMSKGPVALLQTVVPVLMWCIIRRRALRPGPLLAAVGIFLAIALPWPLLMLTKVPGVWHEWFHDVTRVDPADPRPDKWYAYVAVFRHFMPWTLWLVLGLCAAVMSIRRRENAPAELAFWLLVVPLVVMSFFIERKPRYLLPVIPAGAVLAAWTLVHIARGGVSARLRWGCIAFHVAIVSGTAIWIGMLLGWTAGAALLTLLLAAGCVWLMRQRQREWPLLTLTILMMLAFDVAYSTGLSRTAATRSDMKGLANAITAAVPNDMQVVSYWENDRENNAPLDLSIYLNRTVVPVKSIPDAPGVVVIARPARAGVPEHSGWVHLGSAARGPVAWHAFVISKGAAE